MGLTAQNVAQSVLVSLSGSFQTAPNFWLNPKNEVTYQMAVQAPQYRMTSLQDLMAMPVTSAQGPQLLGNLVQMRPVARPATVSHWNVAPVIDVYASTQDRDLGAVAADTDRLLKDFRGQPAPRHPRSSVRGQGATMRASFFGLGVGLVGRHRPGLPAHRRQLPVLAGSLHHHHRPARGAGRHLLVPAADPHHPERAFPHRRGHVHGRGHRQFSILMVSFAREQMDEGLTAFKAAVVGRLHPHAARC